MSAPNWQRFLETTSLDAQDVRQLLAGRAICAHQHRIDLALAPGIQGSPFSGWIKRDWRVEDLREATDGAGVARRVLVAVVDPWDGDPQHRSENLGDIEADALSALCANHPDCLSCVVSVDYTLPADALAARMAVLAARPEVSGLRLIHTQLTKPGENPFADPRFETYCELAAANQLNVELLCREALGHYPFVVQLLERFGGDWPVVINHGGNPDGFGAGGPSSDYRKFLAALAERGNVAMKTAIDEWAAKSSPAEHFFPYWDAMVDAGGFDWLVFETNFPVCLESGAYDSAQEGFRDALGRQLLWLYDRRHEDHLATFMWENAERLYRRAMS
jgi:predicted TIM-barrel fold metal-dependent hydrolase